MAQSILSLHLVVERNNVVGGYFESQPARIPIAVQGNQNQTIELIKEFLHNQALQEVSQQQRPTLNLPPDAGWNDIAMALDEETVDIWFKGKLAAKNVTIKQMGFYNLHRRESNIRWGYMQKLAKYSCLEPPEKDPGGKFAKQISELRHDLRAFFKIGDDPFYPFQLGGFYAPKLKIHPKIPEKQIKGIAIENAQ